MRAALAQISSIAIIVFAVSSMMSVGLAYRPRLLVRPLRDTRAVARALAANFVLVPLLAVGIEWAIPMEPPLALGLFLLAGSAGAPFLIKLTSAAKSDVALSAALLVLLVPLGGKVATVALAGVVVATFGANLHELLRILKTAAVVAGVLLTLGSFAVGYLLSRPEHSAVLGLGTAQRNVAGAMVIASRDFTDPDILLMVTACVLIGLLVLFPIAWLLSRRTPHVGLPTLDASPA